MSGLKFWDQPFSLINCDWMVGMVADLDSAAGGATQKWRNCDVTTSGNVDCAVVSVENSLESSLCIQCHLARGDIPTLSEDSLLC